MAYQLGDDGFWVGVREDGGLIPQRRAARARRGNRQNMQAPVAHPMPAHHYARRHARNVHPLASLIGPVIAGLLIFYAGLSLWHITSNTFIVLGNVTQEITQKAFTVKDKFTNSLSGLFNNKTSQTRIKNPRMPENHNSVSTVETISKSKIVQKSSPVQYALYEPGQFVKKNTSGSVPLATKHVSVKPKTVPYVPVKYGASEEKSYGFVKKKESHIVKEEEIENESDSLANESSALLKKYHESYDVTDTNEMITNESNKLNNIPVKDKQCTGTLNINARGNWGYVSVNGSPKGETPLSVVVPCGTVHVSVRSAEGTSGKYVNIGEGDRASVSFSL